MKADQDLTARSGQWIETLARLDLRMEGWCQNRRVLYRSLLFCDAMEQDAQGR